MLSWLSFLQKPSRQFAGSCGSATTSLLLLVIYSSQSLLITTPFVYSTLHPPVCKCSRNAAIAGPKTLLREEIPDPNDWTNSSSETSHATQNNSEAADKTEGHPWVCRIREHCWQRQMSSRERVRGKAAFAGLRIAGQNNKTLSY